MSVEKTEKRPGAGDNTVTRSRGKTKAHLIDAVHQRHGGITKAEAAEIVDSIFSTMKSTLIDGRTIRGREGHMNGTTSLTSLNPEIRLAISPEAGARDVVLDDE